MTAFQITEAFGGLPEDFIAREMKIAAKALSDSGLSDDIPDDDCTDKAQSRPVWLQTVMTSVAVAVCLILIAGSVRLIALLSKKPDPADSDPNPKPVVSETTTDKTGSDQQTETTASGSTVSDSTDAYDSTDSTAAVTADSASETAATASKDVYDSSERQSESQTTALTVPGSESIVSTDLHPGDSSDYTFDELMSMSSDEFADLSDMSGYLTWSEELKQKYEVIQGCADYDLLMKNEETAAEMYSLPKAAQVLGIPEKMLGIEEPDGEFYDADDVNVTGRMIVLHLDLCAYGNDSERKARAFYLSEKQLRNCEAIAEFTPWRYGA